MELIDTILILIGAGFLIGVGLILVLLSALNRTLDRKRILLLQIFSFLGALLILVFYSKRTEFLFEPVDSFTIGSITFLITTAVNKKTKDTESILLFAGFGSLAYFISGFILTAVKVFPLIQQPLALTFLASLQKSLFFLGSINLTLSAGTFTANRLGTFWDYFNFKKKDNPRLNKKIGLNNWDVRAWICFIMLLLVPLISIFIIGWTKSGFGLIFAVLVATFLPSFLFKQLNRSTSYRRGRLLSFFSAVSVILISVLGTNDWNLVGIPFLVLYFQYVAELYLDGVPE